MREFMRDVFRTIKNLQDTARLARGQSVGIKQQEGPPVIGIITDVSYRKGTVTIALEGAPGESLTAPASKTTFLF